MDANGGREGSREQAGDADEQEWVALAQGGDLAAFNAIVERYQTPAYNVALRMLRDPSAAEDATQDAFVSAWRNVGRYRGGSLRAWLLAIVANRARDLLRSPSRRRTSSLDAYAEEGAALDPPDRGLLPDESAEQAETVAAVRRAVAALPGDQRLVVTLVDLQGLNYEEAAAATGAAVGTVKSRLFRARSRLRDLLRGEWELSGAPPRQNGGTE